MFKDFPFHNQFLKPSLLMKFCLFFSTLKNIQLDCLNLYFILFFKLNLKFVSNFLEVKLKNRV